MISMRPLPTNHPVSAGQKPHSVEPRTLELGPLSGPGSSSNRKSAACPVQRAYPWLLAMSTGLAAVFCGLYLTKPVVLAGTSGPSTALAPDAPSTLSANPATPALIPSDQGLPGDETPARPAPADPRGMVSAASDKSSNPFEETNLRVQHVLAAQGPDGENLGKILLDVPVLYRSRSLRWTPDQVERARDLLARIGDYREKSRSLREEAGALMTAWNDLLDDSIPADSLRADSPSLPANQSPAGSPAGWDTTRAIEVQKD